MALSTKASLCIAIPLRPAASKVSNKKLVQQDEIRMSQIATLSGRLRSLSMGTTTQAKLNHQEVFFRIWQIEINDP
ncbi:hypothetical protein [Herbaspirillum huttiense]|uniref:hypothetical protein n=1 Tax=Herbaspirillum huttiense TaxID=863372 RepID=UPI0039AEFBBF